MTGGDKSSNANNVKHPHDLVTRKVMADHTYIAGEARAILPPELAAELLERFGLDALTAAPTAFITAALGESSCDLLYYATVDDRTTYYPLLPRFRYVLDDLPLVDAAELQARPMPVGAALLLGLLKAVPSSPDVLVDLQIWVPHLRALAVDPDRQAELATMLAYIRNWANADETLWQEFLHSLGPEVEKVYMTIAEQAEARCRVEGSAGTLLRLIEKKFGPVDTVTRERVLTASAAEIDAWTDRILTAPSLREMLG